MFEYLWKYFHTSYSSGDDADDEIDLREEEEEMLDETFQEHNNEDHLDEDEEEPTQQDQPQPSWYHTVEEWIEHVNKVSQKLSKHPGWAAAIDEMLRKFMGRSAETI
jgi:DNA-binding transcriptional regulator GbsR (MarR family)